MRAAMQFLLDSRNYREEVEMDRIVERYKQTHNFKGRHVIFNDIWPPSPLSRFLVLDSHKILDTS